MLNYRSLKDHVYEYISNQIREEALKPGERINENRICEALEVSRTPVREALLQLTLDGYIEQLPRRGFMVKSISLSRVHNIYEIIGALEALAATTCIRKERSIDFDQLEQMVVKMDQLIEAQAYEGYYQLQHEFHQMIIEASGNEDLNKMIGNLKKAFIKQAYTGADYDEYQNALRKTNEEHFQILKLMQAKDVIELRSFIQDVHWNSKYAFMEMLE
ncbi:GntR family transcriptional regulator [Fusibacter ferrireducens]|uniref:GntR family transcriptional regulator n=1 Tax=Fusibacter ferrireducens TaxID=2785058 RepID=A0ABR9ZVV7_9FIRM|nr:GntR family transcriptional regulator [Fusibacter ferrireducens]MBF4693754.1 GntR family transcriptional regulator [Fusibacter ferrireducens]